MSVSCCGLLEGIYNTCNSDSVREMKAVIRSKASLIVAFADDLCIIEKLRGRNSTMSESCCELVEGIYHF